MNWDECLQEHVRQKRKDLEEAKALLALAEEREEFLRQAPQPERFSRLIVEGYYETIKELITALLTADGYISYSHECLLSYLQKFHSLPRQQLLLIDQLRVIRNNINYRGATVTGSYLQQHGDAIREVIAILKNKAKH